VTFLIVKRGADHIAFDHVIARYRFER